VAQGKVKRGGEPPAVAALHVCEKFANGDVLAVENATALGWDAYVQNAESPYVQSFGAGKEFPGLGRADMFSLFETYPESTFGYCRIDMIDVSGDGLAAFQSILDLGSYVGDSTTQDDNHYASLMGRDDKSRQLLAHWADGTFVLQLSIVRPKNTTP
ncbi:MAG: hypothetical protein KKF33_14250, partial [Alphaproteobacteria bacterium]|nr:hypothetical protein [Alphaproteobacteria bacterium]